MASCNRVTELQREEAALKQHDALLDSRTLGSSPVCASATARIRLLKNEDRDFFDCATGAKLVRTRAFRLNGSAQKRKRVNTLSRLSKEICLATPNDTSTNKPLTFHIVTDKHSITDKQINNTAKDTLINVGTFSKSIKQEKRIKSKRAKSSNQLEKGCNSIFQVASDKENNGNNFKSKNRSKTDSKSLRLRAFQNSAVC
jgi:hypothetical protein